MTGLVTDELSGGPLPGAQIQIGETGERAVTAKDGRYTLSLAPGVY